MSVRVATASTAAVRVRSLQFKGAVGYAFGAEHLFQPVGNVIQAVAVGNHHMGGERRLGGADRPDVEMVDVDNALGGFQFVHHCIGVNAFGHGIDTQAQALGEQLPGGDKYHRSDNKSDDGVDDRPAGVGDNYARNHHAG